MTVASTDSQFTVAVLPVHAEKGFPHIVFVNLLNIVYQFMYDFLQFDSSMVMEVTRVLGGKSLWRGRVVERNRWRIRDPDTGTYVLGFYASKVNKDNPEIFVWANPPET